MIEEEVMKEEEEEKRKERKEVLCSSGPARVQTEAAFQHTLKFIST